jgi:hypothetical protein
VHERNTTQARLRYAAGGALAALAAVGAIAGGAALAANPNAATHGHVQAAKGSTTTAAPTKTPAPPGPGKVRSPQPGSSQPLLNDVRQLVDDGTISSAEGQVLDGEIQAGGLDAQALASSGFTQAQLQAVQQSLSDTKRALAPADVGQVKTRAVSGGRERSARR